MTQSRTRVEFYAILGSALTSWVSIERALFRVFLSALDGADPGATSAAYHALQGFKPKLDITSAALEARFSRHPLDSYNGHFHKRHSILDVWFGAKGQPDRKRTSLRAKIRSASEERNKLAHYETLELTEDNISKFVISKSLLNPLNNMPSVVEEAYDFDRIVEMQNGFDSLYREVEGFTTQINDTLGQQRISMLERTGRALDPRPVLDRTNSPNNLRYIND